MNRREEPLNNRAKKKNTKLVRNAVETKEKASRPRNTHGQNLASESRKKILGTKSRLAATLKSIKIKQKKRLSPHSKRTSPGEVDGPISSPAYPNREGSHWIQTVEKQTLSRSKRLGRKLSKQRSK